MSPKDGTLTLTPQGRAQALEHQLLHLDGFPQDPPAKAHLGAMATGKTVREDADLFQRLVRLVRKTIAVEMEAAAIGFATAIANRKALIVKAVSDHADGDKDDRYRLFACRASAQFVLSLLEKHGSEWVRAARHEQPKYENDETRRASEHLDNLERRRQEERAQGQSTTDLDKEIVEIKRSMRAGGVLRAGDVLNNRYRLLDKLGEGGFATVWKAFDLEQTRNVALKALHPHLASERTRIKRFRRGAREMAALEHPAIVRVFDERGDDENHHYFTMELIPGGDLHRAILDKRVSSDRALQLLLDVADALTCAHERDVIHRDVKPSNILLDNTTKPKLTDFDLVAAAHTTGGTRTGILGTAIYAAPELTEQPQHADVRADVYGLAMTAIFVIHGKELSSAILRNFDKFIAALNCTQAVRAVLLRAVEHEPSARFPKMIDFRRALDFALSSPNATVALAIPISRPTPPVWKRNAIVRSDGFILELRDRAEDFAPRIRAESGNIARSFGDAWAQAKVLTEAARDLFLLAIAEGYREVAALAVAIDGSSSIGPGVPEGTVFVVMQRPGGLAGWEVWVDARDAFFQPYGERIKQVIEKEGDFSVAVTSFDVKMFESRTRELLGIFSRTKQNLQDNPAFVDPAVRLKEHVDSGLAALATWLKSHDRCGLLVSPFGGGKTALMMAFCRLQIAPWPIYIRIAQSKDGRDEEGAILDAADANDVPTNRAALTLLLRRGMVFIGVDGLDERPLEATETLETRLQKWMRLAGGHGRVLLSARSHYRTLEKFAHERGAPCMHIEPFDDERIRSILQRGIGDPEASRTWKHIQADSTYLSLAQRPALLMEAGFGANITEQFRAYLRRWTETTSRGAFGALGAEARMQVAQALAATLFDTGYASCAWSDLRPEIRVRLEPLFGGLSGDEAFAEIADGMFLVHDGENRYAFAHKLTQWYFLANHLASMIQKHPLETLAMRPLSPAVIRLLAKDHMTITHAAMGLLRGFTEESPPATEDQIADAKANALRILIEFARGDEGLKIAIPENSDLRGVRLMGESLAEVRLASAQLQGADLSGVDLTGADLTGADLSGARLLAARLDKAVLRDASLREADLTFVAADGCDLTGADLTNAILRQSVWTHCQFDGANLSGSDVSACVLTGREDVSGQTVSPRWLEATVGSLSSSHINLMAWNPTDKCVALGDSDGTIFVVEPSSLLTLARLCGHDKTLIERSVQDMAWNPAGTALASAGGDSSLVLWDSSLAREDRALIAKWDPQDGDDHRKRSISALAWHPTENKLATMVGNEIRIVSASSGEVVVKLDRTYEWPSWSGRLMTWHSHADHVFLVGNKGESWWVDLRSGKIASKSPPLEDIASIGGRCAIANSHGATFAVGDENGRITTIDIDDAGHLLNVTSFQAHEKAVKAMTLAGRRLATGGADSTSAMWDAATGQCIGRVGKQRGAVFAVALDSRGERMLSGDGWGNVRSWDARHHREGPSIGRSRTAAGPAAWAPDGKQLAVGYDDGTLRLWDPACGRVTAETKAHDSAVRALAWDSLGGRIATASDDGSVKIWRANKLDELARLEHNEFNQYVFDVAWHPSGQRVVTCTEVGPIVWDILGRKPSQLFTRTRIESWISKRWSPQCHSVCFDPTGKRLASGMVGQELLVWDVDTGGEPVVFGQDFLSWYWGTECLAWDKAGKRIVSGGIRGLAVWNGETAQEVFRCQGHSAVITSVAWSPTEQFIASASHDGTARIWNAETGAELHCLLGHTDHVTAVTWDPSGSRLATASKDGTIKIWDTTTYQLLCTLEAAGPRSLARTPGGYCLFEDRGGEGPPFCLTARRPERLGSAVFLPLGGLRNALHRPDKVEAALRGDLSRDGELEMDLVRRGLGGGVQWDGKQHIIS